MPIEFIDQHIVRKQIGLDGIENLQYSNNDDSNNGAVVFQPMYGNASGSAGNW